MERVNGGGLFHWQEMKPGVFSLAGIGEGSSANWSEKEASLQSIPDRVELAGPVGKLIHPPFGLTFATFTLKCEDTNVHSHSKNSRSFFLPFDYL